MAGRIIEVDTSILRTDISSIEGELRNATKGADRLDTILHELESMWEGDAKQAFSAAVSDDLRRLRELIKAITKFTQDTDTARQNYEKCENAVSQIVASIRV